MKPEQPELEKREIPQKYWDELSQPPSPKGEDLLIQNTVIAIEICGMLVNSSSKTLQFFWCLPHDALVQQNITKI